MRRLARAFGVILVAGGLLTLVWVLVVWQWQDPFTAIYTHFEQARLSHTYEKRAADFHPRLAPRTDLVDPSGAWQRMRAFTRIR